MFNIHPLTYIFIFLGLFSGKFRIIILFLILIIVHELGHLLTAKIFNWKTDKIYIYPLGGITKFKDSINKPFIEEFLVAIMGPFFQMIITIILYNSNKDILVLSNSLFLFNLLPIVPLDGGRILTIILSLFKPFKKTMIIVIKISFIIYILLIVYIINKSSYFFLLIIIFLLFKIIDEKNNINYLFNRFIIERLLLVNRYKSSVLINRIKDMYKYRNNIIKDKNKIYNEKEYIDIFLNKKNCKKV